MGRTKYSVSNHIIQTLIEIASEYPNEIYWHGGDPMDQTFITSVDIMKVRHLKNITIPLSDNHRKHLILTGKNGSGKTSVLDALQTLLIYVVGNNFRTKEEIQERIDINENNIKVSSTEKEKHIEQKNKEHLSMWKNELQHWTNGAIPICTSYADLREKYEKGQFIIAYFRDERISNVDVSNTIEKIELKDKYSVTEMPGKQLVKYMVGLKATQAFARQKKDFQRAEEIEIWFNRLEDVLRHIFKDTTLQLDFDIETFEFSIHQSGREPFDFNTMSKGYSAVFNIINDLIMRVEKQKNYDIEGIVLIDEIETHLHIELQKDILPFLTEMFPNIQFIVSSHSPFILNSIDNAVIYDLETNNLVENGLANFPYDGVVEGYFQADKLSNDLRIKLDRYKTLTEKENWSDEDLAEISELEDDLDEIPDFLSPEIASEYNRLKLEFSNRGEN